MRKSRFLWQFVNQHPVVAGTIAAPLGAAIFEGIKYLVSEPPEPEKPPPLPRETVALSCAGVGFFAAGTTGNPIAAVGAVLACEGFVSMIEFSRGVQK